MYAGTASKSLAPGVRLGWLVVPGPLLDAVLAARAHGDWPSAIDQLTLAELIASGGYDRHVRRLRIAYRRRRDRLLAAVERVRGIDAGCTPWSSSARTKRLLSSGRAATT